MRPAWLVGDEYLCSYCGRDLRITLMRRPRAPWVAFAQQWMLSGDRLVWKHARRGRGAFHDGRRAYDSRTYPTPAVVVCRNVDCGEPVVVDVPSPRA